jgi:hypothetical protein
MRYGPILALAFAACSGGPPERRYALASRPPVYLLGGWDAELSLKQSYQIGPREPVGKVICGTLGFVENHYAKGWSGELDEAAHLGVYDLDLAQLGLDWLADKSYPIAIAASVDDYRAVTNAASDSVAVVLNPGSQERIVLLGRYTVDGIRGHWTAQSSRGTASGSFLLTPHVNAPSESPGCSELH